jgi:hypothetical protein
MRETGHNANAPLRNEKNWYCWQQSLLCHHPGWRKLLCCRIHSWTSATGAYTTPASTLYLSIRDSHSHVTQTCTTCSSWDDSGRYRMHRILGAVQVARSLLPKWLCRTSGGCYEVGRRSCWNGDDLPKRLSTVACSITMRPLSFVNHIQPTASNSLIAAKAGR